MEENNIEKKILTLKDLMKPEYQHLKHLQDCSLSHIPLHLSSCSCLIVQTKKDETS